MSLAVQASCILHLRHASPGKAKAFYSDCSSALAVQAHQAVVLVSFNAVSHDPTIRTSTALQILWDVALEKDFMGWHDPNSSCITLRLLSWFGVLEQAASKASMMPAKTLVKHLA